jgi:hypothetical protein
MSLCFGAISALAGSNEPAAAVLLPICLSGQSPRPICGLRVQRGRGVGGERQRNGGVGMAATLLHHPGVDTGGQHERGAGVTQVVRA